MQKDFDTWNTIKKQIDGTGRLPTFKEREIWWCSVGINIGYEVCGKGKKFWRPVLVLDKHNAFTFLGIPLTSKVKKNSRYHYPIYFRDHHGSLQLGQARTFSSERLSNKMGTLPDPLFDEIRSAFRMTI